MADADIYSLFLGAPDAAAQAQAQAEALRRRREGAALARNAGNVALLSGDRVLSNFGQAQLRQAGEGDVEAGRMEGLLAQAGSQGAGRALQEALAQRQQAFQAAENAENRALRERTFADSAAARREDRLARQEARVDARADREAARADAREEREAARTQARTDKLAERNVGGFEFDMERPPSAVGASKMAAAAIPIEVISRSLNRMKAIYDKHGPEKYGQFAGELESDWINVTNNLRVLNEMGVPNGADYAMLAKQLEDPSEFKAFLTGEGRAKAQLNLLEKQINERVDATAKALNYRRAKPAAQSGGETPAEAPTELMLDGVRHVRQADGTYVPG